MNGFEAYQLFQAIKLHFTTDSYNFFKYQGKVKSASPDNFEIVKGKYFYERLAKKYPDKDQLTDFIVANLLLHPKSWVADLLDGQAQDNYFQYLNKFESLTYNFKSELIKLLDYCEAEGMKVSDTFKNVDNWQWLNSGMALENIIILDHFIQFMSLWNDQSEDNILWPDFYQRVSKYAPFVLKKANLPKLEEILISEMRVRI